MRIALVAGALGLVTASAVGLLLPEQDVRPTNVPAIDLGVLSTQSLVPTPSAPPEQGPPAATAAPTTDASVPPVRRASAPPPEPAPGPDDVDDLDEPDDADEPDDSEPDGVDDD